MLECVKNCLICKNDRCIDDIFLCENCNTEHDAMNESNVNSICWECFDDMVIKKLKSLGFQNIVIIKENYESVTLAVLDYIKVNRRS